MTVANKHLVFGGARPGTPWGSLGLITARALAPLGYEVRVDPEASRGRSPGLLTQGQLDLAATTANMTCWAYRGTHIYADLGPHPRLRVIATIMSPNWLGIAIRKELGITDLAQIKDHKPALRVSAQGSWGQAGERALAYHGVTRELIEAWGGRYLGEVVRSPGDPHGGLNEGPTEVDLIIGGVNAAYTFESAPLHEAAMAMDLEFLPLPADLIRDLSAEFGGEPGFIPYRLVRGVDRDTPSVSMPWQLIYARDDLPEDFAYLLAKAYDDQRHLFRETLMPYSYDSKTVAYDHGIPLHPGAARYYREMGYLR